MIKHATLFAALALMALSSLQAIAAVLSKENGSYPYKPVAATLLSEVLKLTTSAAFLALELRRESFAVALHATRRSVLMAAVPGFAYQILNNLNFVTLYYVDATTFQILGNTKIVATGIAGLCLLNRQLTAGKWLALVLLSLGAVVSQLPWEGGGRTLGYVAAVVCVFLSATMGVFTEMYMKGHKASIHWQNIQLYFFGIWANLAALVVRDELGTLTSLLRGFNVWAVVVVFTNGFAGLAVAFLLRYADSIAKTYAHALAIPCTGLASHLVLGTRIAAPNVLGSVIMLISLLYYYAGPTLFDDKLHAINARSGDAAMTQKLLANA